MYRHCVTSRELYTCGVREGRHVLVCCITSRLISSPSNTGSGRRAPSRGRSSPGTFAASTVWRGAAVTASVACPWLRALWPSRKCRSLWPARAKSCCQFQNKKAGDDLTISAVETRDTHMPLSKHRSKIQISRFCHTVYFGVNDRNVLPTTQANLLLKLPVPHWRILVIKHKSHADRKKRTEPSRKRISNAHRTDKPSCYSTNFLSLLMWLVCAWESHLTWSPLLRHGDLAEVQQLPERWKAYRGERWARIKFFSAEFEKCRSFLFENKNLAAACVRYVFWQRASNETFPRIPQKVVENDKPSSNVPFPTRHSRVWTPTSLTSPPNQRLKRGWGGTALPIQVEHQVIPGERLGCLRSLLRLEPWSTVSNVKTLNSYCSKLKFRNLIQVAAKAALYNWGS